MPRPQFTLRALLVAMLVVAAFFGGIRFERERRRRADDVMVPQFPAPVVIDADYWPQAPAKNDASPFE
ncbi:MAG TPA: hypothetical protein VG826_35470 [Pirellulales bacterium]|nr:hypothetical protein [Pirellulales bacterium]